MASKYETYSEGGRKAEEEPSNASLIYNLEEEDSTSYEEIVKAQEVNEKLD